MSLTYCQDDGAIFFNAVKLGAGYSGHGEGKNNPAMEAVPNIGPIPRGKWRIVQPPYTHPKLGPLVFNLEPIGHDAHKRSLFRWHGDSMLHPGEASDGCICSGLIIRQKLESEKLTELEVI